MTPMDDGCRCNVSVGSQATRTGVGRDDVAMGDLPTIVETERLTLRCWTADDAPAINTAIVASTEQLRPWMPWIAFEPKSIADRRELIETWERERVEGGDTVYGIFLGGVAVGGTGLHRRRGPGVLEIGYWVHADHVGQGYATEVAAALTDTAFSCTDIDRVEIHHDAGNVASGRVPAKLGFTMVAEVTTPVVAPAETGRSHVWQILRPDWPPIARSVAR
jgi:ribosomal-protein-serine acetyltransferase